MEELLYKDEVYNIVGAAMEVHRELGPGLLEAVYQEALEIEFSSQRIPYVSQPKIEIYYKNRKLKKYYEPDLIACNKIVIEIKAQKALGNIEEAQLFNTIKCCRKELGLLMNFGELSLRWKRFIFKLN
ncbi:MAG: GxxExxY protein [Candidatus Caldatribacteriota bacterium]|nr:GxxExxY protein [Candidatus Caldatribacteriota bacterium]